MRKLIAAIKNTDRNDLRYLWFFPIYLAAYFVVERVNIGSEYHTVHFFLDDLIPFNEYFVIPYLSWHVLTAVLTIYIMIRDSESFRKMMRFFIIGALFSFGFFIIYPSCHGLRPTYFDRNNLFTWIVSVVYYFDTPENVCPSMHVIGSMGLFFGVAGSRKNINVSQKTIMGVLVFYICASTLLIKQHSVVDVAAALPISFISWIFSMSEFDPRFVRRVRSIFTAPGILTLPNALSFFRLLLIPVIVRLYMRGFILRTAVITLLSAFLGAIDGGVARRFGMTSDLGKLLDPFAHKLTLAALIICLSSSCEIMWALLIVMAVKELIQLVFGYLLLNDYDQVIGVKWYGRFCTLVLYFSVLVLILFPDLSSLCIRIITIVCCLIIFISMIMNAIYHFRIFWGTDFRRNMSRVISTLVLSIWIFALLAALAEHDRISAAAVMSFTTQNVYAAVLVILLMFALKTLSVFFYSGVIFAASGVLFGLYGGVAVNIAGAAVMVAEGYFMGRCLVGLSAEGVMDKYPKLRAFASLREKGTFRYVFLIRMMKVINFDIGSMFLGSIKCSFLPYLAASILGMLPEILLYALAGSGLSTMNGRSVGAAAAIYIILTVSSAILLKRISKEENAEDC